jgi:hypothetical protein
MCAQIERWCKNKKATRMRIIEIGFEYFTTVAAARSRPHVFVKCVYLKLGREDVYKTECLYGHRLVTERTQTGHIIDTDWSQNRHRLVTDRSQTGHSR